MIENPNSFNMMLSGKRIFFYTNTTDIVKLSNGNEYFKYQTTSFLKDKDDPNKNCGKPDPNSLYNVTLLKTPINEIEYIRQYYSNFHKDKIEAILINIAEMIDSKTWDRIYSDMNSLTDILKNPEEEIIQIKKGILFQGKNIIADTVIPPRLIFRLDNYFDLGVSIIEKFLSKDIISLDITHYLFNQEKNKQLFSKDFTVSTKLLHIKPLIQTLEPDKLFFNNCEIKLNVGIDLPNRNQLNSLLKTKLPIKIYLIVLEKNELGYRYATLIEHDENYGVYFNPNSNLKLNGKKK